MAGHSRRFTKAGYTDPKPFLLIDGKPMIERVCQMFSAKDEFILVCNRQHLAVPKYMQILKTLPFNCRIVGIEPHEEGPVFTALQAKKIIADPLEPIILSYCDFTMVWNYPQFILKASLYDGAIAVFRGFHPASCGDTYYAYLKSNEQLEMLELREKRSFTNNRLEEFASTGVYYLDSWKMFEAYAHELLAVQEKVAAEYYCSLIYNYLVRDGKKVALYETQKFICWGTPEDLSEYYFWSNYFAGAAHPIMARELA